MLMKFYKVIYWQIIIKSKELVSYKIDKIDKEICHFVGLYKL
jgi:hypothetical protein